MTTNFKSNSRFAALMEDVTPQKNNKKAINKEQINKDPKPVTQEQRNYFKSDNFRNDNFRNDNFRNDTTSFRTYDTKEKQQKREMERIQQKEFEEKEKVRKSQEALSINNFPDLVVNVKKENKINDISYVEKLKIIKNQELTSDIIDTDLVELNPGWVLLKKDPLTRKTIFKTQKENFVSNETEKEYGIKIINSLVNLHQRRTQEYIELYGYDNWEKTFKSPKWCEEEKSDSDESDEEYDYEEEDGY